MKPTIFGNVKSLDSLGSFKSLQLAGDLRGKFQDSVVAKRFLCSTS